ncbi:TetR/AcrR family transcriptional regulator [Oleomonas cavernae]|uniref:TetR/AcrR family transcriptional regulator n=1 Tax=Oleomonas cavernae TaxID=2320859 RepID=A0A418VU05_9PROT|nr:TetR/AcrR family transcriptional regulator [Oleomonas cavernae]RJF80635.1 TetR/AcrR family transcriptional regulator [Oleomonas cavernae]
MAETTPSKPGRKTAAVLTAAKRLFLERGYAGTSMDAVAAAAPVSKRTLYQYFPGKEELFGAVIDSVWSGLGSTAIPAGEDPRAVLRGFVERLIAHWEHPDVIPLLRLIMAEAPRAPELSAAYYARGKAPAVATLAAYLRPLAARGSLATADPELAAVQFLGMIKEALFWPRVLGVPAGLDADKVIAGAIDRVLIAPENKK